MQRRTNRHRIVARLLQARAPRGVTHRQVHTQMREAEAPQACHFYWCERRTVARGAKTDRTSTNFYRNLAKALRDGATVTEAITHDHLNEREAYTIEKRLIEELYLQNPEQLSNTVDDRFIGITWKEFKQNRQQAMERSRAYVEQFRLRMKTNVNN